MGKKQSLTLCWDCRKACGGCSWSQGFIPVKGWEATPSKIRRCEGGFINSFIVHKCPLFEKDNLPFMEAVSCFDLGKLLGVSARSISRYTELELKQKISAIGLSIKIRYANGNRKLYIFRQRENKIGIYPLELAKEMGIDINSHRYYRKTNIFGMK